MLLLVFRFLIELFSMVYYFMLSIELWPGMNLLLFNLTLLLIPLIIKFVKFTISEIADTYEEDEKYLRYRDRKERYDFEKTKLKYNSSQHSYHPVHSKAFAYKSSKKYYYPSHNKGYVYRGD